MKIQEINLLFPNKVDAIRYFENLRWGDKVECAYCNSEKVSERQVDGRFHCSSCRRTFSITTGTILQHTKISLKCWLCAFSAASSFNGKFSAAYIMRETGVSYATAWYMSVTIKSIIKIGLYSETGSIPFDSICRFAISSGFSNVKLQKQIII